jgi:hypothetical protein
LETPLKIDDRIAAELDKLGRLVDSSSTFTNLEIQEEIGDKLECQSPLLCNEFQTARLFLSHLGFLSVDGLQVLLNCRFFSSYQISVYFL